MITPEQQALIANSLKGAAPSSASGGTASWYQDMQQQAQDVSRQNAPAPTVPSLAADLGKEYNGARQKIAGAVTTAADRLSRDNATGDTSLPSELKKAGHVVEGGLGAAAGGVQAIFAPLSAAFQKGADATGIHPVEAAMNTDAGKAFASWAAAHPEAATNLQDALTVGTAGLSEGATGTLGATDVGATVNAAKTAVTENAPALIDSAKNAVKESFTRTPQVDAATGAGATEALSGLRTKISEGNVAPNLASSVDRLGQTGDAAHDPLSAYDNYFEQEQKFKADGKEDTALGLVGQKIGDSYDQVAKIRQAAGKTMSDEMSRVGDTKLDVSAHDAPLEQELSDNGVSIGEDGKLETSRTSKITDQDKNLLQDYVAKLRELGPNPTAAELDAFLSRTPEELDVFKQQNNITKVTNGERIVKSNLRDLASELSSKNNPEFATYAQAKSDYASLSKFLDEGSKHLGAKTQSGDFARDASVAKSSVQSILNGGKKDWLLKLEKLTGFPAIDHSMVALQAMKDAGNFRGNSLLELLSPESKGNIPLSKHGIIGKGIDAGLNAGKKALVGTPQEQTRRIIQSILDKLEESPKASGGVRDTQEFKDFPRDTSLTGEHAQVQEDAIHKYMSDPQAMLQDYLKNNGNVVNTDEARKLFGDIGYNGSNSAAVHTPSKAISDAAFEHHLSNAKPGQDAYFMAGGSGAGKSSTTKALRAQMDRAAVVFDGNLSSYDSALKKINASEAKGLNVTIPYVYREPVQAWKGVIDRMLGTGSDAGRVVPLKNFLENTPGSLDVVKRLVSEGKPTVGFDNSFGQGNAKNLSMDDLKKLSIAPNLEETLISETEDMVRSGKITDSAQYESLLKGFPHESFDKLAQR
jgi:hypothetical protein